MIPRTRSAQSGPRWVALLLALVCLWMSSGGVLRHTDDLAALRAFAAGRDALHRSAAAAPAAPCAAHQWMDALRTLPSAPPPVSLTAVVVARVSVIPAPALHLRCFKDTPPRGPPSVLS